MRLFAVLLGFAILVSLSCGDKSNPSTPQIVKICDTLQCSNGGYCQDGHCICPSGWTGPNCQTPVTTDPCQNMTCKNGGYCQNGACVCPQDWAGADCGTRVDPCATVTCYNGGYCINGQCSCPAGWEGPACERIKTPTKIRITKLVINGFPQMTSTGGGWDLFDGPDIFPVIKKGDLTLFNSTKYYENAVSGTSYTFTDGLPIDLTSPSAYYSISLYDYDLTGNDWMCGYDFVPFNGSSFPATNRIKLTTSAFDVTLHLTYAFN